MAVDVAAAEIVDLANTPLRDLNQRLHGLAGDADGPRSWRIVNPSGIHNIACGLDADIDVVIEGHAGYYCAGMNQRARVRVTGNAGQGVAENMMSGRVTVDGNASQAAGATAHGGLLHIRGDASARCGISLKGAAIVVEGSVGHMSAFMAQTGTIIVLGDAGEALGDSMYETHVYVRGTVGGLGADVISKELREVHRQEAAGLLADAGVTGIDISDLRRYGSARQLYTFKVDNVY